MKEQFRNWNFRGNLKINYRDSNGNKKLWTKEQDILLSEIDGIITQYQDINITLTNRQLYYQLVAGGIIPNADDVYKRICKFLTDARYAGLIDWSAIEDRGRKPHIHADWNSVSDLISDACYTYRLPRWKDQDTYLELYVEKQAMESVLKPVANKYHIHFGYNKGYSSASVMYDLSKRVKTQLELGKEVKILYLGDHDPSGLDMIRDIAERTEEFLTKSENRVEAFTSFEVIQIALNMTQIKKYNPPPNPAKITDPRAKWYIAKYGQSSWELDALKPELLMKLTETEIQKHIDMDKYNAWIALEDEQKQALEEFGKSLDDEEK